MRLNKFLAHHSTYSRREADELIAKGMVTVNGTVASLGQRIEISDVVAINGHLLAAISYIYVLFHKPVGYVCSRRSQGAPTVYDLLPRKYQHLNTVGRLDKDSSGLLLLTNDGQYAHEMTHPSFEKEKVYEIALSANLKDEQKQKIEAGLELEDGNSQLKIESLGSPDRWRVVMGEGRNRQIRRTFAAMGLEVTALHRTQFGPYSLEGLKSGKFKEVERR